MLGFTNRLQLRYKESKFVTSAGNKILYSTIQQFNFDIEKGHTKKKKNTHTAHESHWKKIREA